MTKKTQMGTTMVANGLALVLALVTPIVANAAPVPDAEPSAGGTHGAQPWKAVAASGAVEARLSTGVQEVWESVARGDELRPAMLVRTGRSGRATLSRNASLVIIDPRSQVELPARPRPGMDTSVIQRKGSVLYEVDSRRDPHFEVVTPYLVAGVKGTKFLVTVHEDYTAVTVRSGLVEVMHPETGEVRAVGAGETLIRERDRDEMDLIDGQRARTEIKQLSRLDSRAHGGAALGEPRNPATGSGGSSVHVVNWLGDAVGGGAHHGATDANAYGSGDAHGHTVGLPDEIDARTETDNCGEAADVCTPDDLTDPGTARPGEGTTKPPVTDPVHDDPVTVDPALLRSDAPAGGPTEALLMLLGEQSVEHEFEEREIEQEKGDRAVRRGQVRRAR